MTLLADLQRLRVLARHRAPPALAYGGDPEKMYARLVELLTEMNNPTPEHLAKVATEQALWTPEQRAANTAEGERILARLTVLFEREDFPPTPNRSAL